MAINELVGASLGLLTHARRHEIDLGPAGELLCAALERAAPGSRLVLDELAPVSALRKKTRHYRRKLNRDFKRQPGHVAKVDPIKRNPVSIGETNRLI